MKTIVYGTTNPAKVAQLRDILTPLGIEVTGLPDAKYVPVVDELGGTAEENARLKAVQYAAALELLVISMDTGLYFNDLPEDLQPGLHVRRMNGTDRASDEELIEYYTSLAARLGDDGRLRGYWRYAYALAWPDGRCESFTADAHRIFMDKPSKNRTPGFPLESLQIDPESGVYIADMTAEVRAVFWRRQSSDVVCDFVKKHGV